MAICSMPKVEPFSPLHNHDFEYLNTDKSLSRRMLLMADMLSLTSEEHCERESIVSDMLKMLKPYYPECDVLVFGSSANGFGFKDCDLDLLFLPFPEYCNLDFKDKGSGVVPVPRSVLNGTVSRKKLYLMDEEMHLNFVQRIFYTVRRYFKKVCFIPAKCPILNIEFVFTPLQCDFSVSNRLVLYNTQLLWIYGKLDVRVKPLVMFLRFWTKSLGFISKSLLSSYCLTLLVIFFLQNTRPAILPSVKYLNSLADYSRIIDGWETAICLDINQINANRYENRRTLSELLMEFLNFYWNFDFVQNIVSVHKGEPLPVTLIKQSQDEQIRDFLVTPFSVQDPFILSRNASRNSAMKTPFQISLMIAKGLLSTREFDFQLLFNPSYYQDEINSIFASTKNDLPAGTAFLTLQLTYDIHKTLALTSHLTPWFDKVSQGVLDILQYGLLIDCEVVDKVILDNSNLERPSKKRKFSIHNIGNLKLLMSIQCVVNFPTLWRRNRAQVLEHLKKTGASLEIEDFDAEIPVCLKTEYKVSKELSTEKIKSVTQLPNVEGAPPYFSFICNCFHHPEPQLSDIVVSFSPATIIKNKSYNETKEFIKQFVHKYIKLILVEA